MGVCILKTLIGCETKIKVIVTEVAEHAWVESSCLSLH